MPKHFNIHLSATLLIVLIAIMPHSKENRLAKQFASLAAGERFDTVPKAKNYLSSKELQQFVADTKAEIIPPRKGKPFDTLRFNKVIAYEFDGREEYNTYAVYESDYPPFFRFAPVVKKQTALTQSQVDGILSVLTKSSSYGSNTAACFEPRLCLAFYQDNQPVMQVGICLSCNYLESTIPIPAKTSHKSKVFNPIGFSKAGRNGIKKLCDALGYYYEKKSMFD